METGCAKKKSDIGEKGSVFFPFQVPTLKISLLKQAIASKNPSKEKM